MVKWNPQVKLILADIDDTIATPYEESPQELIQELSKLLKEDIILFFVTGGGLARAQQRIIEKIERGLRKNILIAHCNGAEIWGFDQKGHSRTEPFYGVYDTALTDYQKQVWRECVGQVIKEFDLKTFDPISKPLFREQTNHDPKSVMFDDRGPQITLEFPNDPEFREPVLKRAAQIFDEREIPINPQLGGMMALDFVIKGVSKTTAVKFILEDEKILETVSLTTQDIKDPEKLEIWGDRYANNGGDMGMVYAVDKKVRAINFRREDPEDFPEGYNIVVWDGEKELVEGLVEYLKLR